MKVLSLFDGISCGMVALERAGIPVERYVAYEIEENAIKISKKNYPQIEHCGDVTTADFIQYKEFDLLIGGSPCTHWSIARGNETRETTASGIGWDLFRQYVRALKEANPKWFLYENNVSMSDEIKHCISKELGFEPIMIDSADFSAQTRKRYYWTNIPIQKWIPKDIVLRDIIFDAKDVPEKYWYTKYEVTVHDGDPKIKATIHLNSHRQAKEVYSINHKCNTLLCDGSGGNIMKKVYQDNRVRKLMPVEYERLQTLPDEYTAGVSDSARYSAIGNGWTVDVIAHIFRGMILEDTTDCIFCRKYTNRRLF